LCVFVCLDGFLRVVCRVPRLREREKESHIHTSSLSAKPRGCQWSRDATVRHRVKLLVSSLHLFGEGRERNLFSFLLSLFSYFLHLFRFLLCDLRKERKKKYYVKE
jgi:hypothetical protein